MSEGASPAPDWTALIKEGWSPPYVVTVEATPENKPSDRKTGTGILLDEKHVLTCLHVVHAFEEIRPDKLERRSKDTPLPSFHSQDPPPTLSVRLFGAAACPVRSRFIAEDTTFDLAIVELQTPIHGILAPLGKSSRPAGPAVVVSFIENDGTSRPAHFDVTIEEGGSLTVDGRRATYSYSFGAPGGFSGGPVFSHVNGGLPSFIGVAVLGGEGSATGEIIAAETIWEFLGRNRTGGGITRSTEASAAAIRGYRQTIGPARFQGDQELPRFDCMISSDIHQPPVFISRTPISAAAADAAFGKTVRRGGEKLPAHIEHRGDVAVLLDKLRTATGLPLRVPHRDEWTRFQRERCRSNECIIPVGRPAYLSDFASGDELYPSPGNVREWLLGAYGLGLFMTGTNGAIKNIREGADARLDVSRDHERHVLRLAFTPGEAV